MKTNTHHSANAKKGTTARTFVPLGLETRPTVDTAAYSFYLHIEPQTARVHACKETGPIKPIRIAGSAKLHWPTAEIRRVLGVGAALVEDPQSQVLDRRPGVNARKVL